MSDWPTKAPSDQKWPHFRDGTPVRLGDEIITFYGPVPVRGIKVTSDGYWLYGDLIADRIPVPVDLARVYENEMISKADARQHVLNAARFESEPYELRPDDEDDLDRAEENEIWGSHWAECQPAWPLDDKRHPYNWEVEHGE